MSKATDAIRDTVAPKNGEGKLDLKKLLKRWATFMAVCGVVGTLWTAFSYVKDKLDAIEESTASISDMKDQNAALTGRIDELEQNLEAAINRRTLATQTEFAQQREVDVELRGSINSVLTEVRLRHGADPPEGGLHPTRSRAAAVREAARESDNAQIRAGNAMPQADPLAGINELE